MSGSDRLCMSATDHGQTEKADCGKQKEDSPHLTYRFNISYRSYSCYLVNQDLHLVCTRLPNKMSGFCCWCVGA